MKRKQILFLPLLLMLLLGLGLVAYPMISSHYTERHQSQVYTQYQEVIEKADGKELDTARAETERRIYGTAKQTRKDHGALSALIPR